VARGAVALRIVGIALRCTGIPATGELQGGVVGEVARAAGIGDGQNLPVGIEAVGEARQRRRAQRVGDAARPAGRREIGYLFVFFKKTTASQIRCPRNSWNSDGFSLSGKSIKKPGNKDE